MSSSDDDKDDDKDERWREPSVVSLKSDMSMDIPLRFRDKRWREPSVVSLKSDMSMDIPLRFRDESDKPGTSHSSTVQPDNADQHRVPDNSINWMSGAIEHQRRTLEQETEVNMFKSKQQKKFQTINEGISIHRNLKLVNEIYTELYITSDCGCGHISDKHEIRYFEKACRRPTIEGAIHGNDILKLLPGDVKPIRVVLTDGIAGIGKTVSVQKFVLDWAEGKANQDLDFIFRFSFRELNFMKQDLSLLQLLHWIFPETKELKIDYHQHKIMFIFDGLDESRFSFDFLNSKILGDITESASVNVLVTNLIKGNLLPSALLWITSRPAASSQIPPVYISRVTEVRGFNDPRKEEYFRKRISDQTLAYKIISHLKSSQSLYIMCHVPVFCWIAATVLEEMFSQADTGEVPKTLTQMFTHFLVLQIERGCEKYKKCEVKNGDIAEIVSKLGKLAFQQLEKGNLIFYEEDITECGISVQEATVYSGVCTRIFIEEVTFQQGKLYSFVHLSVQEHLAAVYAFLSIINRSSSKQQTTEIFDLPNTAPLIDLLKTALNTALKSKNGHLDLFLRFVMGLSLESNSHLLQHLMMETGRSYLRENAEVTKKEITTYIRKKIKNNPTGCRTINLFHCLIELDDQTLVPEARAILSKTISQSFHRLNLSRVLWSALVFLLMNSEDELEEFNLHMYDTSDECLINMHPVITAYRKALLCDSNLTMKSCKSLAKVLSLECSSLRELDLSDNKLQDSGVKLLSEGLKSQHCKLETLRLCNCDLTEKSCEVLASVLTSKKMCLKELHLSCNKLQDLGMKQLSKALESPNCKLETLRLFDCGITQEGGTHLISALISNPSHLKELDLGWNKIGDPGIKLISDFLTNELCKLETLKLRKCNITKEGCIALHAALRSTSHLKELDLSANDLQEQEVQLLTAIQEDETFALVKLEF